MRDIFESSVVLNEGAVKDAFQKLKVSMVNSNQKFLNKHKNNATNADISNVVISKWYTLIDMESKFKAVLKKVDNEFKVSDKMNLEQLKKFYKDMNGGLLTEGKATALSRELLGGKSFTSVKDLALKETKDHKVTKSDVDNAIKYLENCSKQIDEAERDYNEMYAAFTYGTYYKSVLGKTKNEKLAIKIAELKRSLVKNITFNYQKCVLTQLRTMQTQSRLVVLKASKDAVKEAFEIDDMNINMLINECFNDTMFDYILTECGDSEEKEDENIDESFDSLIESILSEADDDTEDNSDDSKDSDDDTVNESFDSLIESILSEADDDTEDNSDDSKDSDDDTVKESFEDLLSKLID